MNSNAVLIEIKNPSIKKLMFVIEAIKANELEFEIKESISDSYYKHGGGQQLLKKQIGYKGMEVLKLLAEGKKYTEIATDTGITINGVRYYVKKIFRNLAVDNGRDAVRIYLTELQYE